MAYITQTTTSNDTRLDWNTLISVKQCSPAEARRYATRRPDIRFYLTCHSTVTFDNDKHFAAGDALFFGGQAPQHAYPNTTLYSKTFMTIAYVNTNDHRLEDVLEYTLKNGDPFFDIVAIFAANTNAPSNNSAHFYANGGVQATLDSGIVRALQDKGVAVIVSVLGNHSNAGWSNFQNDADATAFADELAHVVNQYGLDGIDIDDEYSKGTPNRTSLTRVSRALRRALPDRQLSKALFRDSQYFNQRVDNQTLADCLSYGWEMSYFSNAFDARLSPYLRSGMTHRNLLLGVSTDMSSRAQSAAQYVKRNGYGGIMVYNVGKGQRSLMSTIGNTLFPTLM